MKTKYDKNQYDLFGYEESLDDRLHRLKVQQEKIRRSFFARYNVVMKELDLIQDEIQELQHENKLEVVK